MIFRSRGRSNVPSAGCGLAPAIRPLASKPRLRDPCPLWQYSWRVLGRAIGQVVAAASDAPETVVPEPSLISIVDDDQSFRDSMRRLLKSHGYAIAVFPSAADFLGSSQLPATACLVADIHMPVMTGVELYRHLVATGHSIPTILITAHPEEGLQQRVLSLGVDCYLHKPLDESVLIDCLRRACSRDRAHRAVP